MHKVFNYKVVNVLITVPISFLLVASKLGINLIIAYK